MPQSAGPKYLHRRPDRHRSGHGLELVTSPEDPRQSVWVFRYYDFDERSMKAYGKALVRLIDFVRDSDGLGQREPEAAGEHHRAFDGGLIVREAVQVAYPLERRRPTSCINKIVTLGTPHRGIAFQRIRDWKLVEAADELERFNPKAQADRKNPWASVLNFAKHFPPPRLLRWSGPTTSSYGTQVAATFLNRLLLARRKNTAGTTTAATGW